MYKCGVDSTDVLSRIAHTAEKDLSTLLETHVSIHIEKASGRANRESLDENYSPGDL